jgi:hypothetical protein
MDQSEDIRQKNIFAIITVVVILSGLVGNIVSIVIFSRKTFRKNSISIYCRAMAIFDSFTIYMAIIDFYLLLYSYYIAMYSDFMCKFINYIMYAFGSIPGWILIAFSVEKVLSLKRVTTGMKRPIVHYAIVIGIVLFNLLLYIEIPIFLKLLPVEMYGITFLFCDPSSLYFAEALSVIFLIQGSIIPFVVLLASSLITIKLLKDSRRQVSMIDNKRMSRDTKFAVTSLIFNFLFIILKLPLLYCSSVGYMVVNNYLLQVANLLFFVYFSIGFWIHFVSNSLFRRELFILLGIRPKVQQSSHKQSPTNKRTSSWLQV